MSMRSWHDQRDRTHYPADRYAYGEARTLKVVPVRKQDGRWIFTDEHRAEAWAVVCFRRGHKAEQITRHAKKGNYILYSRNRIG